MNKKILLNHSSIFIFFLTAFLFTSGCQFRQEKKPLKIAINVWPGYAHAFLAKDKGIFGKNGVNVELVLAKSTGESLMMYRNGEVDGIFHPLSDLVLLSTEGYRTKVVYIADYSDNGDVIIGKARSLAALRKKTVGIDSANSFSHIFAVTALEKSGIKESEQRFEIVPAIDVLRALDEGRVDAGHTWEPVTSRALKKGYSVLAKAGDYNVIIDVLAFNDKVSSNRRKDVENIVKSMIEARDLVLSSPEDSVALMAKAEGMSIEEMRNGLAGVRLPDIAQNLNALSKGAEDASSLKASAKTVSQFYLSRGQFSEMPDLDYLIDPSFAQAAGKH